MSYRRAPFLIAKYIEQMSLVKAMVIKSIALMLIYLIKQFLSLKTFANENLFLERFKNFFHQKLILDQSIDN